jgi:hypothetical protein
MAQCFRLEILGLQRVSLTQSLKSLLYQVLCRYFAGCCSFATQTPFNRFAALQKATRYFTKAIAERSSGAFPTPSFTRKPIRKLLSTPSLIAAKILKNGANVCNKTYMAQEELTEIDKSPEYIGWMCREVAIGVEAGIGVISMNGRSIRLKQKRFLSTRHTASLPAKQRHLCVGYVRCRANNFNYINSLYSILLSLYIGRF